MTQNETSLEDELADIRQKKRIEYIEANLIFQTQEEMAKQLNVARSTVARDLDEWKKQGGYNRWLMKEFFELYGREKRRNITKALDRICFLIGKSIGATVTAVDQPKELVLMIHPDMMSVDDNSNKSSVAATEAKTVNEQSGTSDSNTTLSTG